MVCGKMAVTNKGYKDYQGAQNNCHWIDCLEPAEDQLNPT